MSRLKVRLIRLACALLLLAPALRARAQNEDFGIWVGGFVNGKLPPALNDTSGSWRLWLDVQLRFGDDASTFAQGIIRPGVGYSLSRAWTVWLGYAYIRTEPPYASTSTYESRLWEQATWSGRVGGSRLSSRTRLEERFVSTGSQTGWRLREFVKLIVPIASRWSGVVSDEFFYNLNSTNYGATAGPDRNRFFIGPGVSVSPTVTIEFGYLHQYTFRNNAPDKIDNVLAASVFWNY
jgi:hypothetical protein